MEIFNHKYLQLENEEIIGFCLNQNCQYATQYCYESLNTNHSDHFNDFIRFPKMIQLIDEFMQIYNQSRKQFKEISKQVQNCFEQIFNKMDQDIKVLENMTQQLLNQDYLSIKSQIHIIKQLYFKKQENYICIFLFNYNRIINKLINSKQVTIRQLDSILDTLKNMVRDQTQSDDKLKEIKQENEDTKRQNIKEAERLLNDGVALSIYLYCFKVVRKLNKYQEAIELYEKAICINPRYDTAWNNKGNALLIHLYCFKIEAIYCYDTAIAINPKYDTAQNNKGNALSIHQFFFEIVLKLNKYQEAIECYDKAIFINPRYDTAWNNKGLALSIYLYNSRIVQNLNKYQESVECYDKIISFNPKFDAAWYNKGNALSFHLYCFEIVWNLNNYQEAIQCYDKAIGINPRYDSAWNHKGFALSIHQYFLRLYGNQINIKKLLNAMTKLFPLILKMILHGIIRDWVVDSLIKYQDAIECYDKAISINSKYDPAWTNKGFALILDYNYLLLHELKKYKDAIVCYDQALLICINPLRLKRKADSLVLMSSILKIFELGNKKEAKQCYQAALEQGSNEKDYITKQLSKL